VHCESDFVAGRTLGAAMATRLHVDREFEADLAHARREMACSAVAPSDCSA
jgi:hypothetical protein